MRKLADYTAEQLVFVDESAANEHTSNRKYGWALVGVTSHEYRRLERSKRWSVLPAYTIDGFITWGIEHGSFSQELFEDFIENKLLPICNPFPGVRSVIIMDNAPIHQHEIY
jgi:DDE superfamily endonuclease